MWTLRNEAHESDEDHKGEAYPAFANTSVGLSWFNQDISGRQVWWHNGGATGFKTCNYSCNNPAVAVVVLCKMQMTTGETFTGWARTSFGN